MVAGEQRGPRGDAAQKLGKFPPARRIFWRRAGARVLAPGRDTFWGGYAGYFADPDTAFVVAPQVYANLNESFVARGAAELAYLFHGVIQRGGNGHGAPLLIGTNHLYRPAAFRQIGNAVPPLLAEQLACAVRSPRQEVDRPTPDRIGELASGRRGGNYFEEVVREAVTLQERPADGQTPPWQWAAFILSGQMAVAYWMVHAPQSFFPVQNGGDAAILFCFVFLYVFVAGPGAWSLDARRATVTA